MLPEWLLSATISTNDLARNSREANVALRYMTRSSGSENLDNRLWEKTLTEVERGWLVDPLVWEDLPNEATVSRRSPLEQSGKVRPIDELSQSQVNATVTVFEQVTLDGPGVICAFAFFMMKCLRSTGKSTCLRGRAPDLAQRTDSLQLQMKVFRAETSDLAIFLTDVRETAIGGLETLVVAMVLFF